MDEGIDDTSREYGEAYETDATGKSDALASMGRSIAQAGANKAGSSAASSGAAAAASKAHPAAAAALKGAEALASKGKSGSASPTAAEQGNLFTGSGKNGANKAGGSKLKKALPLFAIILVLIIAAAAISFIGQSFQLFSLAEMVKKDDNKLSDTVEDRTESIVGMQLEDTSPNGGISKYMQELFAMYGFDYIENENADGTIARALIYNGNEQSNVLVAASSLKDNLMNTLTTSGSIIDAYRDVATVSEGQDEVAAAYYGALSMVAAGAWYDETMTLTYQRLGVSPNKYASLSPNPTDEEIQEAIEKGSVSEDMNAVTGVTSRYVWKTHTYQYCTGWSCSPSGCTCTGHATGTSTDWDWESSLDGAVYEVYPHTTDPYPDTATATEACTKWGSCPALAKQAKHANPKPFEGDDSWDNQGKNVGPSLTKLTRESDKDGVSTGISARSVLAAYSTNPHGASLSNTAFSNRIRLAGTASPDIDEKKADDSVVTAISTLVKNKTVKFSQSLVNAVDQTKAGDGGMEMNYFGNLMNTPAVSYDIDGKEASNMAATESVSFNSWFSDNVKEDKNNKIVKKYNIALSMEEKGVDQKMISNKLDGNYNNIDSTSKNNDIAENVANTDLDGEDWSIDDKYHYCEHTEGSDHSLCPNGDANDGTLNTSEYYVSDDVAQYTYALTSIDLTKHPAGEEAAVAFNEGISLADDAALKQSGGAYGDKQTTAAFYQMQQKQAAKLANYDRHTKSPFDISSKYTFLGSIVASLVPFATSVSHSTIFSSFSTAVGVIGSSVSAMLPSASAVDSLNYITEQVSEDCVSHDSSSMVCDIYGNPIAVMDMEFMNDASNTSNAVAKQMLDWGYVTCEDGSGAKEVCDDGTRAYKLDESYDDSSDDYSYRKWLICTQNDTSVENNLSNEKQDVKVSWWKHPFKAVWDFIKGFFSTSKKPRNQITCGGNFNNDSKAQEKYQYFSQFTLDQRIAALMGDTEESAATAYLKKYYEENPLDQSMEGIIARNSGLTVEEVKDAFAYMEYQVYLARVEATERYHFVEVIAEAISFEEPIVDPLANAAVVRQLQDFEELKNRSFAA